MTTLITGATGGIGSELAYRCAQNDEDLVLVGRNEHKLAALQQSIQQTLHVQVRTVSLDLSLPNAAEQLEQYADQNNLIIDTLINDAGFGEWTTLLDMDERTLRSMMQVNMVTLTELCVRFGKQMKARNHGRILNIASIAAALPGPYMALYYATKAFVRNLTVALAYELRGTGVSATAVCPGPVATGFEQAAHMHGKNFFTMTHPASAEAVANFAFRKMEAGTALAYQGGFAKAMALLLRALPTCVAVRIAAIANGGNPHQVRQEQGQQRAMRAAAKQTA